MYWNQFELTFFCEYFFESHRSNLSLMTSVICLSFLNIWFSLKSTYSSCLMNLTSVSDFFMTMSWYQMLLCNVINLSWTVSQIAWCISFLICCMRCEKSFSFCLKRVYSSLYMLIKLAWFVSFLRSFFTSRQSSSSLKASSVAIVNAHRVSLSRFSFSTAWWIAFSVLFNLFKSYSSLLRISDFMIIVNELSSLFSSCTFDWWWVAA